ncbi:MAG: hypothetical protein WA952_11645 [Lewinella sp.]
MNLSLPAKLSVISISLFLLICCTDSRSEQSGTTPDEVITQPDTFPAGRRNSAGGIEWAIKRYERVLEMDASGTLTCDTQTHNCGSQLPAKIHICRADGDIIRIHHAIDPASGLSATETYFYDGSSAYLAETTRRVVNGEAKMDSLEVRQERRYFESGNLLNRVYRTFTYHPKEAAPTEEQVPFRPTGEGATEVLGSDKLLAIAQGGAYVCEGQ